MSNYTDPENTVELILKIKNSPTLGEVKNLMDTTFPGLFVTVLPKFSNDYPHLNKNWKKEYGGATCILSDASYDNIVYEPEDLDNSYLAFMQKENSWHGYKRIMVNNHRRAVLVTHG